MSAGWVEAADGAGGGVLVRIVLEMDAGDTVIGTACDCAALEDAVVLACEREELSVGGVLPLVDEVSTSVDTAVETRTAGIAPVDTGAAVSVVAVAISHAAPVKPGAHVQLNVPASPWHVPEFPHGALAQSFMLVSQRVPVVPAMHLQAYPPACEANNSIISTSLITYINVHDHIITFFLSCNSSTMANCV